MRYLNEEKLAKLSRISIGVFYMLSYQKDAVYGDIEEDIYQILLNRDVASERQRKITYQNIEDWFKSRQRVKTVGDKALLMYDLHRMQFPNSKYIGEEFVEIFEDARNKVSKLEADLNSDYRAFVKMAIGRERD